MEIEDIVKAAWMAEKPEDMNLVELQLYHTVGLTFGEYRLGIITKEEGERFKQQAIREFEKSRTLYQKFECMVKAYVRLFDHPNEECRRVAQEWRKFF